jgi:hypothetical protein
MMADFDPYWEWLRIPPPHRPPSACQLLGLEPDVRDEERIFDAAARRYEYVRRYVLSPHGHHAQRILGELTQAVVSLTVLQQLAVAEEAEVVLEPLEEGQAALPAPPASRPVSLTDLNERLLAAGPRLAARVAALGGPG